MIFRIEEKKATEGLTKENTRTSLSRKNKQGTLFRLKRGLYCDDPNENVLLIANAMVQPSYVSFEFALSYYGLIPEGVYEITCATLYSRGTTTINNHFGRFSYRNIPVEAYQYALRVLDGALMAGPEKALCDTLHNIRSVRSRRDLRSLLFEDLRIEEQAFDELDKETLLELCSMYPGDTFRILRALLVSFCF